MSERPEAGEIPEAVRDLFDAMPTPVHFLRDDNSNIWVNRAMNEFLGYEPGEIAQLDTTDLYFQYAKEAHEKLVRDLIELGHARGRIMVARKDGRLNEIDFQSTANVLPGVHLTVWEASLSAILEHDHFSWPSAPLGPDFHLTRRESQVYLLVADGAGNPQIASALGIAEATVQQHVDAARAKIGAASRSEMVSRAIGAGLLPAKGPNDTLVLLEESTGPEGSARLASVVYISSSAIRLRPALGGLIGTDLMIRREGDLVVLPVHPSTAEEPSTLYLEGVDSVHFHGRIETALPPGSEGTLHRFGDGMLSLLVRPMTGSRPPSIATE